MHLYHVLSRARLVEKLAHAEANAGRLLLTSHADPMDSAGGALGAYIHLLPNLVGGIDFSRRDEVAAIRVEVRPPIACLRGPRESLDLAAAARECPVLRVWWDEPGLAFQEWLLTDDRAVVDWTSDPEVLRADFEAQLAALRSGDIGPDSWFYPDMALSAQVGMAEIVGMRLGLHPGPADSEGAREAYRSAAYRLGVERSTATKCLFFVEAPFLRLARELGGAEWSGGLPLGFVEVEAPWGELDEALGAASERLVASVGQARGPLEIVFTGCDLSPRAEGVARVRLGFRVHGAVAGLAVVQAPVAREAMHEGPLWDLEDTVRALGPGERLHYVLHRFDGARSAENRVRVGV